MSYKELVKWMWQERTICTLGEGTEASRAHVLNLATWAWPSDDLVLAFLEGWERWETELPAWYVNRHALTRSIATPTALSQPPQYCTNFAGALSLLPKR